MSKSNGHLTQRGSGTYAHYRFKTGNLDKGTEDERHYTEPPTLPKVMGKVSKDSRLTIKLEFHLQCTGRNAPMMKPIVEKKRFS